MAIVGGLFISDVHMDLDFFKGITRAAKKLDLTLFDAGDWSDGRKNAQEYMQKVGKQLGVKELAESEEFQNFSLEKSKGFLKELTKATKGLDYVVVGGNHDVGDLKKDLPEAHHLEDGSYKLGKLVVSGTSNIAQRDYLRVIDPKNQGVEVKDESLENLEAMLSQAERSGESAEELSEKFGKIIRKQSPIYQKFEEEKPDIIMTHRPIAPFGDKASGAGASLYLADKKPIACFSGHNHNDDVTNVDGILGMRYAANAGEIGKERTFAITYFDDIKKKAVGMHIYKWRSQKTAA